jgi:epoxyqueuosine reductase QueG
MNDLTQYIKDELLSHGAALVGVGDLSELPPDVRRGLPMGICVAVKYPKEVIRGIADLPTKEYYDHYSRLNEKLDMLVTLGADALRAFGFEAVSQTRAYVGQYETEYDSPLPHKTVATRAGLGWIGKSALLVTKAFGSMVRISSILTDAPLKTAKPVNKSKCGDCQACTEACPAGAVSGKLWEAGVPRDAFFNAVLCRKTARERAEKGFGMETSICGKCIEICPYTRQYLNA